MLKTAYATTFGDDLDFFSGEDWAGKVSVHYHEKEISIWNVAIFDKFRGKKLGQQMIRETIDFIKSRIKKSGDEISTVYLLVDISNDRAQHVYVKNGFEITGYGNFPNTWRMELKMKNTEQDYFWTVNGNRWVKLNGEILADFLPMESLLKGQRKSPAQIYLENLGFSEDDAEEFLAELRHEDTL